MQNLTARHAELVYSLFLFFLVLVNLRFQHQHLSNIKKNT